MFSHNGMSMGVHEYMITNDHIFKRQINNNYYFAREGVLGRVLLLIKVICSIDY